MSIALASWFTLKSRKGISKFFLKITIQLAKDHDKTYLRYWEICNKDTQNYFLCIFPGLPFLIHPFWSDKQIQLFRNAVRLRGIWRCWRHGSPVCLIARCLQLASCVLSSVWKIIWIFNMHSTSADFISVSCGLISLPYKELWKQFFIKRKIYMSHLFFLFIYPLIFMAE